MGDRVQCCKYSNASKTNLSHISIYEIIHSRFALDIEFLFLLYIRLYSDFSPLLTNAFGHWHGLTVVAAPLLDYRTYTNVYSKSIRIIIHEEGVFPSNRGIEKVLGIGSEHFVKFTGIDTYCSNGVRHMAQTARDCNFEQEQNLRYTFANKIYTQQYYRCFHTNSATDFSAIIKN